MWKTIGKILIGYAVVAIIVLLILRGDVVSLWDKEVKSIGNAITNGEQLLEPLAASAAAVRSGGAHISDAADAISKVPPAIKSVTADVEAVESAIKPIPGEIADFARAASAQIKSAIKSVDDTVSLLATKTIPDTAEMLKQASNDIDQPPFWMTVDTLTDLQTKDKVPNDVTSKLQPLIGDRYIDSDKLTEDKDNFTKALQGVLSKDEMDKFADKVIARSTNPKAGKDVVATIDSLRDTIDDLGENTLPDAAKATDQMGAALQVLVVLLDPAAGALVPLAEDVRGLTFLLGLITADLQGQLQIKKGAWGSVEVPDSKVTVFPGIKKGSLFNIDKGLPAKLGHIKFDVPEHDIDPIVVNKGEWVNEPVPPQNLTLYDSAKMSKGLQDLRTQAEDVIKAIPKANTVGPATTKAKKSMDKTADKLVALAQSLPKIIDNVQKLAKLLFERADAFGTTAATLSDSTKNIDSNAGAFLDNLTKTTTLLNKDVTAALKSLGQLEGDLKNISIDSVITDLNGTGTDLGNLANAISDPRPIGSPGKNDLAERLNDILEGARSAIPPRNLVVAIINGVTGFFIAVHVAILLIGIAFQKVGPRSEWPGAATSNAA